MSYEMKGTVKRIWDAQTFDSGFYKRDFVITTQDQYPSDVKFAALKEKSEQLDSVQVGDMVNVKFDVKGREYNDRYYVDLNAWRIEKMDAANAAAPQNASVEQGAASPDAAAAPAPVIASEPAPAMGTNTAADDDLPF
jgi:single-strand DNA-binding protein